MPRILNHVTVCRDGMHNAFTSLVHWQGAYWIAYRKADGHHSAADARICLSVSCDRVRWREVAHIKVPGDNRDPRFVVVDEHRLALLFPNAPGCIRGADGPETHEQWITFSEDGYRWEKPRRILPEHHHLFRVRKHKGTYYGLDCYREGTLRRLELRASPDLLKWERLCQVGADDQGLNESDMVFLPDGEAWIVSRTECEPKHALFCSAKPPYIDWHVESLGARIHAPAILEHNGKLYVAGRCLPEAIGETAWPFGHSLCIWELTRGKVAPVLRIPATGDCTYPGFIKDPEGRLCISYYSQHAYYLGIVPPFHARVTKEPNKLDKTPMSGYAADIYFAEIELP